MNHQNQILTTSEYIACGGTKAVRARPKRARDRIAGRTHNISRCICVEHREYCDTETLLLKQNATLSDNEKGVSILGCVVRTHECCQLGTRGVFR